MGRKAREGLYVFTVATILIIFPRINWPLLVQLSAGPLKAQGPRPRPRCVNPDLGSVIYLQVMAEKRCCCDIQPQTFQRLMMVYWAHCIRRQDSVASDHWDMVTEEPHLLQWDNIHSLLRQYFKKQQYFSRKTGVSRCMGANLILQPVHASQPAINLLC